MDGYGLKNNLSSVCKQLINYCILVEVFPLIHLIRTASDRFFVNVQVLSVLVTFIL